MVVVAVNLVPRVDPLRLRLGQVEAEHPAVVVADERLRVRRPVGGLHRVLRPEDRPAGAGIDVHELDVASDVVPVGPEVRLRRADEPHVPERGLLDQRVVVGAKVDPHVHLVGERDPVEFLARVGVPEVRYGHRELPPRALQLEYLGAVDVQVDLLRGRARRPAELEGGLPVAVDAGVHVRRLRIEVRPDDEPHLAVGIGPGAEERRGGLEDEVALHLLPDEVILVVVPPHVGSRRRERVFLGVAVVRGGSGNPDGADVGMLLKDADRKVRVGGARGANGADGKRKAEGGKKRDMGRDHGEEFGRHGCWG